MAAKTEAPLLKGAAITRDVRDDGLDYPALTFKGEAPKVGSTVRAEFEGVTYEAKVFGTADRDGQTLVRTHGLTPVLPEPEPEAVPEPPVAPTA